jgi:hypothetical protein
METHLRLKREILGLLGGAVGFDLLLGLVAGLADAFCPVCCGGMARHFVRFKSRARVQNTVEERRRKVGMRVDVHSRAVKGERGVWLAFWSQGLV